MSTAHEMWSVARRYVLLGIEAVAERTDASPRTLQSDDACARVRLPSSNHKHIQNSYRDFVALNRQLRRLGIVPPSPLPGTRGVVAETLRTGRWQRGGRRGWLASWVGGGGGRNEDEAAFLEGRRRGLEVRVCVCFGPFLIDIAEYYFLGGGNMC